MKIRPIFLLSCIIISGLIAEDGSVYHVPIHGTIDMGLPHFIQRVVDEAEENKAKAIIFDIDTFGGRVDAATQIKDIILDSKIHTIAFSGGILWRVFNEGGLSTGNKTRVSVL